MINKAFNFFKRLKNSMASLYYRYLLNTGVGVKVYGSIFIENPKNIKIGDHVTLNHGVYLNARGFIFIGNNVRVSAGCKILTTGLSNNQHYHEPVCIKNDCWLGANSIILPGVTLEEGTIVGAGAVVAKSYLEKGGTLLGVPAKPK